MFARCYDCSFTYTELDMLEAFSPTPQKKLHADERTFLPSAKITGPLILLPFGLLGRGNRRGTLCPRRHVANPGAKCGYCARID